MTKVKAETIKEDKHYISHRIGQGAMAATTAATVRETLAIPGALAIARHVKRINPRPETRGLMVLIPLMMAMIGRRGRMPPNR